jgi:hypothetical protein
VDGEGADGSLPQAALTNMTMALMLMMMMLVLMKDHEGGE